MYFVYSQSHYQGGPQASPYCLGYIIANGSDGRSSRCQLRLIYRIFGGQTSSSSLANSRTKWSLEDGASTGVGRFFNKCLEEGT